MTEKKPSHEDVLILARNAGLDLPDVYLDELALAHEHVRRMVARLPRARPRGDEPAHAFAPLSFLPGKD